MENDQILNINPAFKHLLDKCNIHPNHLKSWSCDIPECKPIRSQQKLSFHFVSKPINLLPKSKITKDELNLKFKPEDLDSIKSAIKDSLKANQIFQLENFDENYNLTEPTEIEKVQEENTKAEKKLQWKDNALEEMKNTATYQELVNYKSGDLKKKKKFTQITQDPSSCPNIKDFKPKNISFIRPFTSASKQSYKMTFSEYCSPQNTAINRIRSKEKTSTDPQNVFRKITSPPVHKIFDSFGLFKLSEKLKTGKTTRSTSEIRARPTAKNANDPNKSYNHIIETCEKEHIINKSFIKDFKQTGTSIVNKFKHLNQENSSEKIKLKIWEKEEIVKYKKKLNEMTKSQMLAFKSINERRISRCSNSDKLLLHP